MKDTPQLTRTLQVSGTAYVSLNATALPAAYDDGSNLPELSNPNAGDLFAQYRKTAIDTLNKAPNTTFTPNLGQIDAVLQSIKVR